ncbi:hypothetical protein UUU_22830 [Klebsiella pneumoniae subsp. pneumoniae DSM 30104 = JCM 1662 = NBRC 14940]|nr:hypothetical protein UUU_22830 [Klebsiella pneumoniae subsp. pneumoniae DSM 30104 = JCM 1662 = NBRC 14940]
MAALDQFPGRGQTDHAAADNDNAFVHNPIYPPLINLSGYVKAFTPAAQLTFYGQGITAG